MYKDIKTIDRNFEKQLPDVQITDIEEFNARQYDVWTTEHGIYAVYIVGGYIESRRDGTKFKLI